MKYKSVIVTENGGPQVLQVTENELREPTDKEVGIKVELLESGQVVGNIILATPEI